MIWKLFIVLGAAGLGYIASSGSKKKVATWFGSTAGGISGPKPEKPELGMVIRMMIADPSRPGTFTEEWGNYTYQPMAIARVKWVGTDKAKGAAIGQIVSIESYQLGDPPPRKPSVGDMVLFGSL